MTTLSHTEISSSHNSAKTHSIASPLHLSAPSIIACNLRLQDIFLYIANAGHNFLELKKLNQERYECLTNNRFIMVKAPRRGRRFGHSKEQETYHRAQQSSVEAKKNGFASILDRFLKDNTWSKLPQTYPPITAAATVAVTATAAAKTKLVVIFQLVASMACISGKAGARRIFVNHL